MAMEVVTKEDLVRFRNELVIEIQGLINQTKEREDKKWLRPKDVRRKFNISLNTLQSLRIRRKLRYSKIGGIIYYATVDLEKLIEDHVIR